MKQRFEASGVCFVPAECKMVVEAESPQDAVRVARASDWRKHIVGGSTDESSAWGWEDLVVVEEGPLR